MSSQQPCNFAAGLDISRQPLVVAVPRRNVATLGLTARTYPFGPARVSLPGVKLLADILIGIVAAIHVYIVVLEMLLWQKPLGRKVFRTTPEQAAQTATLAANQGLYNGFLAAGLLWALLGSAALHRPVATFFLLCVAVAGAFGAVTVSTRILLVQTAPALAALVCLWLGS